MFAEIRSQNIVEAHRLGYPTDKALPLLDDDVTTRELPEIIGRLAALHSVVAASFGLEKDRAQSWLAAQGYTGFLTHKENQYLSRHTTVNEDALFQWQVEALWALAWALLIHDELDFSVSCSENFVQLMPNLENPNETDEFFQQLRMRPFAELVRFCDLAYCLHWAVREAELNDRNQPGLLPAQAVVERRRALDWILTDTDWDEEQLST